jgi:putative two-component system response regulator
VTADALGNAAATTFFSLPSPAFTVPSREEAEKDVEFKKAKIMIVDDEPYNLLLVRKYLENEGYSNFVTTSDASAAERMCKQQDPDLLLLDIMMPGVSGLDILRSLRDDLRTPPLPVLILTASTEAETKKVALELGATDFLSKPLDPNDLLPRVRNALVVKACHDRLKRYSEELEELVQRRTCELSASRQEVIHCLARAAEFRDDDIGKHILRVGRYAALIGMELGFSEARAELLELAAQLHDVGKIGIPDSILRNPGKLDPEQYAMIQKHCGFAKKILQPMDGAELERLRGHAHLGAELLNPSRSPLLILAAQIAQTHHEHWDGNGYPLGLAGEDIPLEGRITAVADAYDALSAARHYKPALPRAKCFAALEEGRGTHFDPTVLDAFFARSDEIVQVQIEYMDVD